MIIQDTGRLRLAVRQELARESDRLYRQAENIGRELAATKLKAAQIHSLEMIAYSSDKLSDIWDFIKKQVGRHPEWRYQEVGTRLLSDLRSLDAMAGQIVGRVKQRHAVGTDTVRQVHISLCREYVSHLAAHFEYERRQRGSADEE